MTKYRAIVSISFDDEDLAEFAEQLGCDPEELEPDEVISGELDNFSIGSPWIEQLFKDGKPTIGRLTGGMQIEINSHED